MYPFYTKIIKEYCLGVPLSEKMKNGKNRHYFREAIKDYVPSSVYLRNDKGDMSGIFFNELKD